MLHYQSTPPIAVCHSRIYNFLAEPLDCIDVFMRDCKCCDGVPLAKAPQQFLRQLIKTQEATYVDLRNYLFARQCNLLLRLGRPSEIAQRTLDFLHNLVHELGMNTLKVCQCLHCRKEVDINAAF